MILQVSTNHIFLKWWNLTVLRSSVQEPLPPPREEMQVDTTCGDAELFLQYFCPNGIPDQRFLGDLWSDAPWQKLGGVFNLYVSKWMLKMQVGIQVNFEVIATSVNHVHKVFRFGFDSIIGVITTLCAAIGWPSEASTLSGWLQVSKPLWPLGGGLSAWGVS